MYPELTKSEYVVIGVLWDSAEELTIQEIVSACNSKYHKDWKSQTVSTFLSHMVDKGAVKMRKDHRNYFYSPLVPKDYYTKVETENIVNNWYQGSHESFLLALCHDTLTEEQYKKIKEILDGRN